jgi:hypothetical protein
VTVTVNIPGRAYLACLDPLATGVPEEEGWPEPRIIKRGRLEFSARYELTRYQAYQMMTHMRDFGETLGGAGVDDELREGPACLRGAYALAKALGHEDELYPATRPPRDVG